MGDHAEWAIEEEDLAPGSDEEADLIKLQAKEGVKEPKYHRRGLIRSFGKLLIENKPTWGWMLATMAGSIGGGAATAIIPQPPGQHRVHFWSIHTQLSNPHIQGFILGPCVCLRCHWCRDLLFCHGLRLQ